MSSSLVCSTLLDSLRTTLETLQPPELERRLDVGVTSTGKSLA